MFQFRAFPSYTYLIQYMILRYCLSVFPHSEISGSQLICSSPKLIAACRVLHRLLMPRHSPCALLSLTFRRRNLRFTPWLNHQPHPFRSASFSSFDSNPLTLGFESRFQKRSLVLQRLVLLNYAGLQQKMSHKIVFTLLGTDLSICSLKSSTMLFLTLRIPAQRPLLPCFSSPLFSFQGASPAAAGGGE